MHHSIVPADCSGCQLSWQFIAHVFVTHPLWTRLKSIRCAASLPSLPMAPITHPMPTITDSTCNPSNPMPAARCTIRLTVTKGHLCCFVLCALAQSDVQHFDTFGKRPLALAALPSPPFFFIFLSMSNQTLPPILIQKVSDKRSAIMPPHDNCRGSQKGLGLLTE